ncbi:facilitated trehalose transporter Tret1-like [Oratosquilla oratoria]|uniref:facilitated trehalose transporter Tret1-like n=1 Tax=Oratosquilla oratoria TaxID=337810 RepID=UPI003F766110
MTSVVSARLQSEAKERRDNRGRWNIRFTSNEVNMETLEDSTSVAVEIPPYPLGNTRIPGLVRQIGCALILTGTFLSQGHAMAWPVVLTRMLNDTITEDDIQWLVTLRSLPGIFTPVVAGTLMEVIGPRRLLTFCLPPTILLWFLLAFLPSKAMFYGGRFVLGALLAFIKTIVVPLASELVSPEIRGSLGSTQRIYLSLGLLTMYIMAKYLSCSTATAICAAPLVPIFAMVMFVPESPYWLVKKGKQREALQALTFLLGSELSALEEIEKLEFGLQTLPSTTVDDQFTQLKVPSNNKPVILMVVLAATLYMCGQSAIFQYTVIIFDHANVEIDSFYCAIGVGVVCLLFNLVAVVVIEWTGRRCLLFVATAGCTCALVVTFLVLHLNVSPGWISLIFVFTFVAFFALGVDPVINLFIGELLPTPVRSIGSSLCISSSFIGVLIASYTFPFMVASVGMAYSFLIFAGFNALVGVIVYIWAPETRGKSLLELQEAFSSQHSREMYRKIYIRKQSINLGREISDDMLDAVSNLPPRISFSSSSE